MRLHGTLRGAAGEPPLTSAENNALRVARCLIAGGHCRGSLAVTRLHQGEDICAHEAVGLLSIDHDRYSVLGAVFRATRGDIAQFLRCYEYLRSRLPHNFTSIDHLNDCENMTQADILEWLDHCIAFAGL